MTYVYRNLPFALLTATLGAVVGARIGHTTQAAGWAALAGGLACLILLSLWDWRSRLRAGRVGQVADAMRKERG